MPGKKCPGSLGFAEPRPADVVCPGCGTAVEIWSDEATATCASCGKLVIRTDTQSCIDWCRFAKECLGEEGYREYGAMKAAIRQAALLRAVEERLGADSPELALSRTVARFAAQFCSQERLANPMVVVAAAVLLCLAKQGPGAGEAGDDAKRSGSGPAAVTKILRDLHYEEQATAAVGAIQRSVLEAAAGTATPPAGPDYGLVHDALLLAALEQQHAAGQPVSPEKLLATCLTDQGKAVAMEMRRSLRRSASGGEQHG